MHLTYDLLCRLAEPNDLRRTDDRAWLVTGHWCYRWTAVPEGLDVIPEAQDYLAEILKCPREPMYMTPGVHKAQSETCTECNEFGQRVYYADPDVDDPETAVLDVCEDCDGTGMIRNPGAYRILKGDDGTETAIGLRYVGLLLNMPVVRLVGAQGREPRFQPLMSLREDGTVHAIVMPMNVDPRRGVRVEPGP